ncbi:hypothetical protein ACFWZ3_06330 [Frateuria sp. GZRR35]|uniref:hypothetical protein n=1 Tax=unclassified Frateuria TaxID=2648894 RepID=UPI003EDB75C6
MDISIQTLMLAIKAMQRDAAWHEQRACDDQITDEDAEYYGQYALDLSRALSELGTVYEVARKQHPDSPSVDDLLAG